VDGIYGVGACKGANIGLANFVVGHRFSGRENVVEAACLGRDAGHVKEGDGTVARERGAKMLHLVGRWHALDADERGHLPIVAGKSSDDGAKRAPVVELARRKADIVDECSTSTFVVIVAVARGVVEVSGRQS